jgi:phage terminase large subunit-like protein
MDHLQPDPVTLYASDVVAGRIVAGPWVRKACKRHLDDLVSAPKRGLKWDLDAALWHIQFFPEVLKLAEGEHAGQPFDLQPWQKFIQGSLFGWKREDGSRRFRTAYVEIGKGNGKSPMAGGTAVYMLCADGEMGAHCYAAATSLEQADELYRDAVNMVEASPDLRESLTLSGKRKVFNIAHLPSGSFFRKVSAEHRGLDGKRIHFAALDEVHEATALVVQKIRKGVKGRRQPLIYEITNSGNNRESVCWDHHNYSEKVLDGHFIDDEWFSYMCALDEGDDWRDEKVWIKANPNLGVSIPLDYLRKEVREAQGIPSQEAITKRLNFCIWNEDGRRWMPIEPWDACGKLSSDWKTLREELKGQECYGGIDLALTNDLSAFALVFPPTTARSYWAVLVWFWINRDTMNERIRKEGVKYDVYEKLGALEVTPGAVTDHDFIEKKIKELAADYVIKEIASDPSRAVPLVTHLIDMNGADWVVNYPQSCASMNAPIKFMEKLIAENNLAHGNHPLLRMCVSNARTIENSNAEIKFDKAKATGRIDGIVATADAFGRARFAPPPTDFSNLLMVYDPRKK